MKDKFNIIFPFLTQSWFFLAFTEWRRSIIPSRGKGESRLDFFWLTLSLSLIMILSLILIATKEGFTYRMVDVVLGYSEDYGVPIETVPNPNKYVKLTDETISVIKHKLNGSTKILAFPAYEIFTDELISLPYEEFEEKTSFTGWAVYENNPLIAPLKLNLQTNPLNLQIIINEKIFNRNFKCDKYIKAIREELLKKDMPSYNPSSNLQPKQACIKNDIIWLKVKLRGSMLLVSFKVHWYQPRFPVSSPIAYAITFAQYDTLKFLSKNNDLLADFNSTEENKNWISGLRYKRNKDDINEIKLLDCLAPRGKTRQSEYLTIKPSPSYLVENCAKKSGVYFSKDIRNEKNKPESYLSITGSVSKNKVLQLKLEIDNNKQFYKIKIINQNDLPSQKKLQAISESHVFNAVTFYVKDRTKIASMAKKITSPLDETDEPFFIHFAVYEDSLIRSGFLTEIIKLLQSIYKIVFSLLIISLLTMLIGFIVSHRQRFIAIFNAEGMTMVDTIKLFFTQLFFSLITALLVTWCAIQVIASYVQQGVELILASNDDYLNFVSQSSRIFDILPITSTDYLTVFVSTLILCCIAFISYIIPAYLKEPSEVL